MALNSLNFVISGVSPTSAQGAGVIGGAYSGLQEFSRADIVGTIQGATGGTLNLIVQTSYDGKHVGDPTKRWWDVAAFAQEASLGAVANFLITLIRGGSGAAPVALTQGTLAAGTVLPNALGDSLRLWGVPGAGTNAGALQQLEVGMLQVP